MARRTRSEVGTVPPPREELHEPWRLQALILIARFVTTVPLPLPGRDNGPEYGAQNMVPSMVPSMVWYAWFDGCNGDAGGGSRG